MIVFRLAVEQYASDLSGKGAGLAGGRWNSKGVDVLYTAESIALCMLEFAAHIPLGLAPPNFFLIRIEIPDNLLSLMQVKVPAELPSGWRVYPYRQEVQRIGDKFISDNESLVLKVPSALVPESSNYLINPRHKSFGKIRIKAKDKIDIDRRLMR